MMEGILSNVVRIGQIDTLWSVAEANELVPLLQKITAKHEGQIGKLLEKQRFLVQTGAKKETIDALDPLVGKEMIIWGQKLAKLGVKVLPGGFIGFDTGAFYLSWHYNEESIQFWHGYRENPMITPRHSMNHLIAAGMT